VPAYIHVRRRSFSQRSGVMDCPLELNRMKLRYLQLGDGSRDDFEKLIANPETVEALSSR